MSKKEYTPEDLFYSDWNQLPHRTRTEVYDLLLQLRAEEKGTKRYGLLLIFILRKIRKRPRLVEKMNVEQAVDVFNALSFLRESWHEKNFLKLRDKRLSTPDPQLARTTFDHFIYADNEYSTFIVTHDSRYLRQLVATLYQQQFDKEMVAPIARTLKRVDTWQLLNVFYTYSHIRELVVSRCKTLMPVSDTDEPAQPKATGPMWMKLKHRLAETQAFQGYENAGKANMYAALDYLEDLAQQQKERQHAKS